MHHCMKQDLNLKTFIHGHHRRISRRIYGKRGRLVIGRGAYIFGFCLITFFWNGLFLRCVNPNIWIGASSITDLSRSLEISALRITIQTKTMKDLHRNFCIIYKIILGLNKTGFEILYILFRFEFFLAQAQYFTRPKEICRLLWQHKM